MANETARVLTRRKVVIGLLLVIAVGLGFFIWQAVTASRALSSARDHGEALQQRITAGDFTGAERALSALQKDSSTAHDATDGILWDIASKIPYLGRNVAAVQAVSDGLNTATSVNAPIALRLSQDLNAGRFRPVNGRIDLSAVENLTPDVRRAADSIDQARSRLDAIHADGLLFPFNELVAKLQGQVDRAASAAHATATAFSLLPDMLGAVGPRTYLLVIQNPAELRSTGGLPGSIALLRADHGRISMGYQGSAAAVSVPGQPVRLAKDTASEYGPSPATDFRDSNLTPDFPEAARIEKAMVEQHQPVKIDGVVAIDPIAMAGLLDGTGPVTVAPGVTLEAGNAINVLLSQTYQSISDPAQQDTFFQVVARKIFDAVTGGQGDQSKTIRALADSAGAHRIQFWSARSTEESAISGSAIAGELAPAGSRVPHVGLYINDSTAGKMDYFLQYRAAVNGVDCRDDRSSDLRAAIAFTSTMPSDFAALSQFIVGTGEFAPKGTIAFNLRIYAPAGGQIVGLQVDGTTHSVTDDMHHGRQVAYLPVSLKPGQQTTVTADIRTAPGQSGDGVFDFTPGMLPAPNSVPIPSPCN